MAGISMFSKEQQVWLIRLLMRQTIKTTISERRSLIINFRLPTSEATFSLDSDYKGPRGNDFYLLKLLESNRKIPCGSSLREMAIMFCQSLKLAPEETDYILSEIFNQ